MHPLRVEESKKQLANWSHQYPALALSYPLYTHYLNSLANAERLQAVHLFLRPLMAELASAAHFARIELVNAICSTVDWQGRLAGSSPVPGLPHEFLERVAIPTLLDQKRTHPDDAWPCVWLALLPWSQLTKSLTEDSRDLLNRARALAPNDEFICERVADARHQQIKFACHHLPDCLLDSAGNILASIAELRDLTALLSEQRRPFFLDEASRWEAVVVEFANNGSALKPSS
jgi:hypothetical protein